MTPASRQANWSAIVLAGGTGHRLGGVDKAALDVAGVTLLDHLIDALPVDVPVVIAGPERPTSRGVTFRMEDPPRTGPVAGIAAAMAAVGTPLVAVIAVDIPWSPPVVARLVDELVLDTHADGLVPVDGDGRRQLMCSVWRTSVLAAALDRLGDPRGRSVRALVEGMRVHERDLTPVEASLLADIDTPADLARERNHGRGPTLGETDSTE
jgi:molybdopterin-guanine dinucleotide biosynthesis protein A